MANVWMSIDWCTELYNERNGTFTAERYENEILKPYDLSYGAVIFNSFFYAE